MVDDGSDDETTAQARQAGATVIERDHRRYGAALKTVKQYDSERIVILDADGKHDPSDIPRLVKTQQETGANLVIGSRFTDVAETDTPLYRRFGLAVVNVFTNLSYDPVRPPSWIHNTQSGFRTYDQTAIASLTADDRIGDRMSASTDILYHAYINDWAIAEVGTEITYDVDDASSRHPMSYGVTLVRNILRTIEQERPVTVLGIPAFLLVMLGSCSATRRLRTISHPVCSY